MTLAYSTAVRNAMLDAITTAAGANAILKIQDGTRPATGGALTNTLSTHTCNATFAPAAAAGVLTLNAIGSATAALTGTATWARITSSGGTFVVDMSAGADVVTTATGTAGQDTITVGSATGILAGMGVSGTGIGAGAVVDFVTGTTIHLTVVNSGAVSGNGTFVFDLRINPAAITSGQTVNVTSATITGGNP
jgi:hypothetical protein